jgi:hypothetical protein
MPLVFSNLCYISVLMTPVQHVPSVVLHVEFLPVVYSPHLVGERLFLQFKFGSLSSFFKIVLLLDTQKMYLAVIQFPSDLLQQPYKHLPKSVASLPDWPQARVCPHTRLSRSS